MSPLLAFQVQGSWQHIHYFTSAYYETDWPIGAALLVTPGRHVDFKLTVDHIRHNVTGGGVAYTENRALLIAEYRLWQ